MLYSPGYCKFNLHSKGSDTEVFVSMAQQFKTAKPMAS